MLASSCQLSFIQLQLDLAPHQQKLFEVLHQKSAHPFQADLRLRTSKYSAAPLLADRPAIFIIFPWFWPTLCILLFIRCQLRLERSINRFWFFEPGGHWQLQSYRLPQNWYVSSDFQGKGNACDLPEGVPMAAVQAETQSEDCVSKDYSSLRRNLLSICLCKVSCSLSLYGLGATICPNAPRIPFCCARRTLTTHQNTFSRLLC